MATTAANAESYDAEDGADSVEFESDLDDISGYSSSDYYEATGTQRPGYNPNAIPTAGGGGRAGRMSSLDWETLRNADFDSLSDVAAAWSAYASEADLRTSLLDDDQRPQRRRRQPRTGRLRRGGRRGHPGRAKRIVELADEDIEGPARISALCEAAAEKFEEKQTELATLIGDAGVYLFPTGGVGDERFKVMNRPLQLPVRIEHHHDQHR